MTLYESGILPAVNGYLKKLSEEERDYGEYWSGSSAGYCMRKQIFQRLKIPEIIDEIDNARKHRVFSSGHIFHEWIQHITEESGLSIAQELELQDDELMIRGHCDDVIEIDHLILYDYKTAHSKSFHYGKGRPMSYYHKMQVATYVYMLRKIPAYASLEEARVLKISKDDLVMQEHQLIYTPAVEEEVLTYWKELNRFWATKEMPACTCHLHEGGFMAKDKWNPYFYDGEPCSLKYYELKLKELNE